MFAKILIAGVIGAAIVWGLDLAIKRLTNEEREP